ncbi:MAG: PBP1A family penicillin-binding protein, partial [Bacilli bacterium]|nr:PBP1A family penicillin-binding protein [Bacilli bacterium]
MKLLKRLFILLFFAFLAFVIFNVGAFLYVKVTPTLEIKNANKLSLYDYQEDLFFQGTGATEWISLDNISPYLIKATLAVEDKNFFNHNGFDYLRIIKAAYINLLEGAIVQGASTISQQYTKNLFLDFNKTWQRKIEEFWLTYELEAHYSKEQILEGYLNTINYGHGVYGIENAANFYFDKKAKHLSLAEASILAGIPKNPSRYSPLIDELEAKQRQNLVLNMMVKNHYITKDKKDLTQQERVVYLGTKDKLNLSTLMYYQDAVIRELKEITTIPASFLETGGLKIYTNLDVNAQTYLEESVKKNLKDNLDIEVAAVMLKPETGAILALVGGRDYSNSPFNRAVQSRRQVGSTLKPFLYYAALENGFTASTTFISEPTTFTFGVNKSYSPRNYAEKYGNKPITMALALAYSDNIYAVKTHMFLGPNILVDVSKRFGIMTDLTPIPSLPLGTEEINIIDLTGGYAALANEGYKVEPYLISRVEDINGHILYERKKKKEIPLDKSLIFIINELLANSYDYSLIDYNYPTCLSIAPRLTKKYAIKSGTTDADLWAIGYNKDVVLGVWVGYDDNKFVPATEYLYAKNIWVDSVENHLKEKEDNWYSIPSNVVGVLVDPITGKPATNNDAR